jgi:hypothetical protein
MENGGTAPRLLSSSLDVGEKSASHHSESTPSDWDPGIRRIGGWVGPTVGLDAEEQRNMLQCRKSSQDRPARSPSLHWLSYPSSFSTPDNIRQHCGRTGGRSCQQQLIINIKCYDVRPIKLLLIVGSLSTSKWKRLGSEVLTVVVMKSFVFWDMRSYSALKVNLCFGGIYCCCLQSLRLSQTRNYQATSFTLLLFVLFFRLEEYG